MNKLLEFTSTFRFRLFVGFAVVGIVVSAIATSITYVKARDTLFKEKQETLLTIVSNAALLVDGDEHSTLQSPADMGTETYTKLQQQAFAIAATDDEILYVYTMRKNNQGDIYFVLDAGHDPGSTFQEYEPSEIGLLYLDPSELLRQKFDTFEDAIVETGFYTDEYGTYLTAYAPLRRSDGQMEGVVAVDISAQDIVAQQKEFLNTLLLLSTFSILSAVFFGWLAGRQIAQPILDLVQITSNIKDTKTEIHVKSGTSEIQQLVSSFRNMIGSLNVNEENLRQQTVRLDFQNTELQRSLGLLDKRANQFKAIAEVARSAASIMEENILLSHLTQVISEQFGFYHVGIFLTDDAKEYAVLRAANSPGGKQMLSRGHKLKIGQVGIVGYVTASGNPRIALDVGADAAFFNNPDLPDTHSELALPLRIANEIIGALDVQSTEINAFQKEDAEVLAALADQIAIAIQNTRLHETTQKLLRDAQKMSGSYLKESWRTLQNQQSQIGYMASKDNLVSLSKPVTSEQARKAISSNTTITQNGKSAALAIPIRLREKVVGVMDIRIPNEHDWDADEVDIIEAVADRLSLAIESSLLLHTTQRRAEIERLTADISDRITATTQFDTILRTAAEELSRILGGSEVLVQIQPEVFEQVKE